MSMISDRQRAVFAALADILIPAAEGMPSASEAGAEGSALDRVIELRHDKREAFFRGLNKAADRSPAAALEELNRDDPDAMSAIGLFASAAYYLLPEVRALVGYPGQENRPVEAGTEPDYEDLLQAVLDRGPIYRPTPDGDA